MPLDFSKFGQENSSNNTPPSVSAQSGRMSNGGMDFSKFGAKDTNQTQTKNQNNPTDIWGLLAHPEKGAAAASAVVNKAFGWLTHGTNPLGEMSKGLLKNIANTGVGLGELGGSVAGALGAHDFADKVKKGGQILRGKIGTPSNNWQKAGSFAGDVASLATPAGEEALAGKIGSVLEKAPKIGKLVAGAAKTGIEATKFGLQEGLKTGSAKEGVKSAVTGAALSGTGKIVGGAWKGIKDIPQAEKLAEFLTTEKASTFKFAKDNPDLVKKYKEIADDPSIIPQVAKDFFDKVKETSKKIGSDWKKTESDILKTTEEKIKSGAANVRSGLRNKAQEILRGEGISFSGGKINLSGSAFDKDKEASRLFQGAYDILRSPAKDTKELINKARSVGNLIKADTSPNVKRVALQLKSSIDEHLGELTGGKHAEMKSAYKKGIDPINKIIDEMSTKNKNTGAREFSMDKANGYIKQLVSDFKFDKKEVVAKMQEVMKEKGVSNADWDKEFKAMSVAGKLSRNIPVTGERMKDVILSLGIGNHPFLGLLVSPKFWGNRMTAEAAEKTASTFKDIIAPIAIKKMMIDLFKDKK